VCSLTYVVDFDPEALLDPNPSSSDEENSGFESEEDVNKGREHYADVGKSKLRKKEVVPLGPQYTGSRISRDAIEDEDSDDPFARRLDGDEESEDESDGEDVNGVEASGSDEGEEDEEAFNIDDVDSDEEMDDGEEDEDNSDEQAEDETDATEEDDDEESGGSGHEDADQTAKLREMMQDTKIVASTLSQAAQADIEKGKAIKTQRKTFDTLLNGRIRLQKALISTNSLAAEPHSSATSPEPAIKAAEAAALTLLNNLTDLRSTLDEARTGQKRKRPTPFTADSSSSEIWSHISSTETATRQHRNAILEKWSAKTRGAALNSNKGRLNASAQQTLTDVLNAQLQDSARLVARTQVPRSCAPLQSAVNLPSSERIYDDADFYGLLLKQLLENRSSELNTNGAAEFVVQAPWQLAREAKTKKIVDTKASKGRKLRYTVHEKLQNFMAPEDRGVWGERQVDDLFGGLFGRRVGLGEEEEVVSEEEEDVEEGGLALFRT
jgi:protein AATF/BFR2